MGPNPIFALSIITLILLVIDIYTFSGIKQICRNYSNFKRKSIYTFFWLITFLMIVMVAIYLFFRNSLFDKTNFHLFYYFTGGVMLFYVPKFFFILFLLIHDIFRFIGFLLGKVSQGCFSFFKRYKSSNWILKIGFIVAIIPFIAFLYAMTYGKYNFKVRQETLSFSNLPKAFDGLKIVQISDLHLGSWANNYAQMEKAIELINQQNPDIVVFTGDIVNNTTDEAFGWESILLKIKAKLAKYSILGNHDYGDYWRWSSDIEKQNNLDSMKSWERKAGFNLLLNQSVILTRDSSKIAIIGVENWGKPPFPKYGNLQKALEGVDTSLFKILLSHDPTHWEAEVIDKTNIGLTLSGHTHAMQIGIDIGNFRWSPIKYRYKKWAGMYQHNNQYLYVNIGLGFIGFPGRVGAPPEITVIELKRK